MDSVRPNAVERRRARALWCLGLGALCCGGLYFALAPRDGGTLKSAGLTPDPVHEPLLNPLGRPALRDGVMVIDGDMLPHPKDAHYGIVHYGKPWPGAKIPYLFSTDEAYLGDEPSRARVREAVKRVQARTDIDWVEIDDPAAAPQGYVEVRFWDKRWGSAQVGYVGEAQVVNLPLEPSLRLTLHEFGHVMGLGHEHQHPDRDKFVRVDRSCVPKEHRDSFAPRSKHLVSRPYDIDSIMHYRSAGFCRKDDDDADKDGNTRECAFVDDDPDKGKCYALRRQWGACRRDICQDRDGDGFREYIRGAEDYSEGDVRTIHTLHREMLAPQWPGDSFGRSMVLRRSGEQVSIYVAATQDGPCGALWELRPNAQRDGLVRHQRTPARWGCGANPKARVRLEAMSGGSGEELWVGVSGASARNRGGWVEQWRKDSSGAMTQQRRLSAADWGMPSSAAFGHSMAVHDRDGDGYADDLAIGAPEQDQSGRVYYAQGLGAPDGSEESVAQQMGQLAGSAGVGQSLRWIPEASDAALLLGVGCTRRDDAQCEVSLWRWSQRSELTQIATQADLGIPIHPGVTSSELGASGDGGIWWILPERCAEQGICPSAWPLAPWRQGLVLDGRGLKNPEIRSVRPLHSTRDPAVIVERRSGEAFVVISKGDALSWHPIPTPQALARGQGREFRGWWDAQGIFVVSAWTDLSGERRLDLYRIAKTDSQ